MGHMKAMRLAALIYGTVTMLLAGCAVTTSRVPVAHIGHGAILMGAFGEPVGQEITIGGHKLAQSECRGPLQEGSFRVDAVDGKKLHASVVLLVRGIGEWQEGASATLRGYEVATVRFETINDTNYGPDDSRFKPRQSVWMFFEPLEVIQPKSLKIGKEVWSFY